MKLLSVHIAPAKRIAKIVQGKKTLKTYRFKTVIPFTVIQVESRSHDHGDWCVSERDSVSMVDHKVYCKKTVNELKLKILEYYLNVN